MIVLKNAGYGASDEIIKKNINYIISKQSGGSWGSIDMTAAAIQSLKGFENISGVLDSISKAENYLISNQGDGNFGNSFSASWALQSLPNSNLSKTEKYLASIQQTDGGLENISSDINNRIWSTSYAIPAILHKSWSDILNNFSKPIIQASIDNSFVENKIDNPKIIDLEKKIEDKEEIKVLEKKLDNNVLSASAIGSVENSNIFTSIGSKIVLKTKALFNWLLVSLGF